MLTVGELRKALEGIADDVFVDIDANPSAPDRVFDVLVGLIPCDARINADNDNFTIWIEED